MAIEYPIEELRKLVHHEPDNGKLFWKPRDVSMFSHAKNPSSKCNSWNTRHAGNEITRTDSSHGYYLAQLNRRNFKAHRVMWALYYGEWPKEQLDHINGIRTDNRIANLREVSNQENARNRSVSSKNTSGHTGVHFHKKSKKWQSYISINDTSIYLGCFENIEDAIAIRKEAEKKYGFHENHGKVLTQTQNSVE